MKLNNFFSLLFCSVWATFSLFLFKENVNSIKTIQIQICLSVFYLFNFISLLFVWAIPTALVWRVNRREISANVNGIQIKRKRKLKLKHTLWTILPSKKKKWRNEKKIEMKCRMFKVGMLLSANTNLHWRRRCDDNKHWRYESHLRSVTISTLNAFKWIPLVTPNNRISAFFPFAPTLVIDYFYLLDRKCVEHSGQYAEIPNGNSISFENFMRNCWKFDWFTIWFY